MTQAGVHDVQSTDSLILHNVTAEAVTLQGKKGVRLTLSEEARRQQERLTPQEREPIQQLARIKDRVVIYAHLPTPGRPSRQRCRHHDNEKMGVLSPPPSSRFGGVDIEESERSVDDRPDHQGAGRGRRGVPGADRAVPSRATGALLPDARILAGRRGRPAGYTAGRVARP